MTGLYRILVSGLKQIHVRLLMIGSIVLLFACSEQADTKSNKNVNTEPKKTKSEPTEEITTGMQHGVLTVVLDSSKYPDLAQEVHRIFSVEVDGIYPPEPFFKVDFMDPAQATDDFPNSIVLFPWIKGGGQHIKSGTIIDDVAGSLRNEEAGKTSLKRIGNELYVLSINHRSAIELKRSLTSNSEQLRKQFHDLKVKSLKHTFTSRKYDSKLTSELKREAGFGFAVPDGYKIEKKGKDHFWIQNKIVTRKDVKYTVGSGTRPHKQEATQTTDFNILATWQPYQQENQLETSAIVAWRDSIGRRIWSSKEHDAYMYTEKDHVPVNDQKTTFKDQYAVKLYGHWSIKNKAQGGSFVSYTFYDEQSDRLYYLEGFVYAPGQHKWPLLRTLEAILQTFEIV